MSVYIGTKVVKAEPMTRQAYVDYRGWELPEDENGADEGYLIEYADGGEPNMADRAGYVSWSPRAVFERSYRSLDNGLSFGMAIEALRQGHRVARAGWNGKGMWLELMPAGETSTPSGYEGEALPFIVMKTADDKIVPWLASQTDVLAVDWDATA